jgi:uncharacterized phiE125 gp8 family phage protein
VYRTDVRCEWRRSVDAAIEPLSIDEGKAACSMTHVDEDGLVEAWIRAAREAAETHLHRGLLTQTMVLQLSAFAEAIWLPMAAPLQSVSSVQYYDTAGVLTTLSSSTYAVDTNSQPGLITRAPSAAWPSIQADRRMPVIVTFVVGWTDAVSVPELVKQGMRFWIAALDMDRVGGTVDAEASRKAAASLWDLAGVVTWREPETCLA